MSVSLSSASLYVPSTTSSSSTHLNLAFELRKWRIRASSAASSGVQFTTLESAIAEKDSDAVKEALDQLSEVGWANKWSSQPYVSRRMTSLRELTTLGIKNAENLAIPSVRNDAAFLFTVVGTTGFLGVLAGQLPGDWGFFVPYLIGSISLVVLAVGSISPGLLQAAIGGFSSLFPDYQDRIARHEAAHFLVAYLLGLPILGYSLDIGKEHVNLIDKKLEKLIYSGQLDAKELDRLAVVAMAGLAAEGLQYDKVVGQSADLFTLQRLINRSKPQLSKEQQQNLTRWAIIMGRKRKPDHPRRMMSDVLHNRTSVAPPLEEASHRPASEGPLVPPPSEGPLPPYRPPSVAPQQLPCTRPPRLPSVRPPSMAPQLLSSSAYEPSADPSTSSQPTSGHVSSSSTSTRRGRGCAKGIKEWGTGKKLHIQFDGNYCPIGDNVAKLTTQLGIIVRNGNIVPLTFVDWNSVPDDIVDAIWKDVKDNLNICPEEYKPICMKNCNSIWKDHKNKLKAKYFKPRSSDPNLKDDVPMNVVPSQWEQLVEYWRTSER
ncbi:hypothetical protein CsSME_00006388 [Camellia sinensis var. sinensis]